MENHVPIFFKDNHDILRAGFFIGEVEIEGKQYSIIGSGSSSEQNIYLPSTRVSLDLNYLKNLDSKSTIRNIEKGVSLSSKSMASRKICHTYYIDI